MNDLETLAYRITTVEKYLEHWHQDSRLVIENSGRLNTVEDDIKEIKADLAAIRANQGRNFIASVIAATAGIGTISGILITLTGGGF